MKLSSGRFELVGELLLDGLRVVEFGGEGVSNRVVFLDNRGVFLENRGVFLDKVVFLLCWVLYLHFEGLDVVVLASQLAFELYLHVLNLIGVLLLVFLNLNFKPTDHNFLVLQHMFPVLELSPQLSNFIIERLNLWIDDLKLFLEFLDLVLEGLVVVF